VAVRATEVWQARDRHTCGGDGVLQRGEMNAGIASRVMRKSRQRLAVGLRDIVSRDSATRSRQRRRGRREGRRLHGPNSRWP